MKIFLCIISYIDSQLCYCVDSAKCTYPSGIYPNLTGDHSYIYEEIIAPPMISSKQIVGLKVGCMALDAIIPCPQNC